LLTVEGEEGGGVEVGLRLVELGRRDPLFSLLHCTVLGVKDRVIVRKAGQNFGRE